MGFPCVVFSIAFVMELGTRVTVQASFIYVKNLAEFRFLCLIKIHGTVVGLQQIVCRREKVCDLVACSGMR